MERPEPRRGEQTTAPRDGDGRTGREERGREREERVRRGGEKEKRQPRRGALRSTRAPRRLLRAPGGAGPFGNRIANVIRHFNLQGSGRVDSLTHPRTPSSFSLSVDLKKSQRRRRRATGRASERSGERTSGQAGGDWACGDCTDARAGSAGAARRPKPLGRARSRSRADPGALAALLPALAGPARFWRRRRRQRRPAPAAGGSAAHVDCSPAAPAPPAIPLHTWWLQAQQVAEAFKQEKAA